MNFGRHKSLAQHQTDAMEFSRNYISKDIYYFSLSLLTVAEPKWMAWSKEPRYKPTTGFSKKKIVLRPWKADEEEEWSA